MVPRTSPDARRVTHGGHRGGTPQQPGRGGGTINANLTTAADITRARPLTQNRAVGFIPDVKAGQSDVTEDEAVARLRESNPHGSLVGGFVGVPLYLSITVVAVVMPRG